METRQIFWDNIKRDILGKIEYGTSGSCMYREGNFVFYEHHDFDREDIRDYCYTGKFKVMDYKKAIEKLQRTSRAELTWPLGTLIMGLNNENVELLFRGAPFPSANPGGTPIEGKVRDVCSIEDLLKIESDRKTTESKLTEKAYEKISQAIPTDFNREYLASAVDDLSSEEIGQVIEKLHALYKKREEECQKGVSEICDRAKADAEFGNLPSHMADWHDNEVRAIYISTRKESESIDFAIEILNEICASKSKKSD